VEIHLNVLVKFFKNIKSISTKSTLWHPAVKKRQLKNGRKKTIKEENNYHKHQTYAIIKLFCIKFVFFKAKRWMENNILNIEH
jgi:predicted RNA-binding protein with PIN domain